jgi:hypothetical protein
MDPEGPKTYGSGVDPVYPEHCQIPIFCMLIEIEDYFFTFSSSTYVPQAYDCDDLLVFPLNLMASFFVCGCSAGRRGEGEDVGPEHAHQLQVQAKHRRHTGQVCTPLSQPLHQCFF